MRLLSPAVLLLSVSLMLLWFALRATACTDGTYDYNACRKTCLVRAYRQRSKGQCNWDHSEGHGITTRDCYACVVSRR